MNIDKKKILLAVIVAIAFFLRFYRLTEVPPSLNWDEVSIGYNAYSIMETGKDEWGETMPLHFQSYGEYKLPGQIYASIPAIAVFGLNPFAVRITPVIYGTLTVLFLYFLTKELFNKRSIALVSAFLLAVSPWHVQLTRASFESSFALMWVVLGIWLLVKGFKNSKWWIASMIPFALAVYTYNSARAFVPMLIAALYVLYRKDFLKYKKHALISLVFFTLLLLPLIPSMFSGQGGARFKLVSIVNEAGLVPRIEERRNASTLPDPIIRLIYNRPVYISYYFADNYLAHFTPDFLFISGAGHKQHHVQGIGQLYWIQAPFLLYGLYFLTKRKEKYLGLLLAWMLLAYIPVAFTLDSIPHALRTLNAVPVYQIITAYGVYYLYKLLRKKENLYLILFWLIVIGVFGYQFVNYLDNLYNRYPYLYSREWQYGNKEAVEYIKEHYDDYDLIVYSREYGEPHMFTLFYLGYDPEKYQNDVGLDRYKIYDWVRVKKFDKFYFPDIGTDDRESTTYDEVMEEVGDKKTLIIAEPKEVEGKGKVVKKIDFLDDKEAFLIYEVNGNE